MKKGFTLLELLLVVTVILILLGLTTVIVKKAIEAGEKAERKTAIENVQAALTAYRHHYGHFPESESESNSASMRYVDGASHKWYYPQSSFSQTERSGNNAYRSVSTLDSAELFFALEGEGSAQNPEKIQFIDSSILYTRYNGEVITLKAARDKGASSALRLGVFDKDADDGIAWFGVSLRLDADKAYVSLPVKDGSEWVYNSTRYDD